jgi:thymidylate synthase
MKKLILLAASTLLASSAAFASLEEDIAFVSEVFDGNGNGSYIRSYDPSKLKIEDAAKAMYADRADSGCYSPVIKVVEVEYETQEGLNKHSLDITKGYFSDLRRYQDQTKEEISRMSKIVRGLLRDKTNKFIISSQYDYQSPDDSEGCLVYKYEIYRADGKMVEIEFNETD